MNAIRKLKYVRRGPGNWSDRNVWWFLPWRWAERFQHGGWVCLRWSWLRRFWGEHPDPKPCRSATDTKGGE